MNDSNTIYQAKIINEKLSGVTLPTIEDIVKEKILSSNIQLKKEEIDEAVCRRIKLPMDSSISRAISNILKKLESKNIISHPAHGYWIRN